MLFDVSLICVPFQAPNWCLAVLGQSKFEALLLFLANLTPYQCLTLLLQSRRSHQRYDCRTTSESESFLQDLKCPP